MQIKRKEIIVAVEKSINAEEMTITHYISTPTPDRYREIMNPLGCDDTDFKKNPVVFFGHRSRELPIAKNVSLSYGDAGVLAVTKFDSSEFAKEVFRLNVEGFLNSWSIGFMPVGEIGTKDGCDYIEKWNFLEYSSVPIPANPDAVNLMLKEIKNDRVKGIIEHENEILILRSKYDELEESLKEIKKFYDVDVLGEINSIKTAHQDEVEKALIREREHSEKTESLIKSEIGIFEDRLVRKLNEIVVS